MFPAPVSLYQKVLKFRSSYIVPGSAVTTPSGGTIPTNPPPPVPPAEMFSTPPAMRFNSVLIVSLRCGVLPQERKEGCAINHGPMLSVAAAMRWRIRLYESLRRGLFCGSAPALFCRSPSHRTAAVQSVSCRRGMSPPLRKDGSAISVVRAPERLPAHGVVTNQPEINCNPRIQTRCRNASR